MEIFMRKATDNTPNILGIIKEGKLSMSGRSFPEDSLAFFGSFNNWLDEFFKWDHESVEFTVDMDYMNTSTEVIISHLVRRLGEFSNRKKVRVIWKYDKEDLDIKAFGEDLKFMNGNIIRLEPKEQVTT